MRRASGAGAVAVLLVARNVMEGVLFAALFAAAQVLTRGDRQLPIVATALGLTGVGIILTSVLRDARADRQNGAIALTTIGAAALLGLGLAPPHSEGLALLTRIVLFGILGEAFVWRDLTVARALIRWSNARDAGFTAIGAVALVALLPGAIDRTGLVLAGLAATAATGIALSLARSAEELSLAGRDARGETGRSTASGTAIFLAILSVLGAVVAPFTGDVLRRVGETAAPIIGNLLYGVLLALGYVAELFVNLARALVTRVSLPQLAPPALPLSPEEEAEALREIEATRPFVLGAVEVIVAIVALLAVILLVDRMARERRQALPEGATLDRDSAEGEGLGAFLAGLLPRRRGRVRPPRDDGTPSGALRALYWRYLASADASGVPWRAVSETPAEHHLRAAAAAARHESAGMVVRAFEELRYGDIEPSAETVTRARAAIAEIERPG